MRLIGESSSLVVLACDLAACSPSAPAHEPQPAPVSAPTHSAVGPLAPEIEPLVSALAAARRSAADRARDAARHPRQTLEFFGIQPTSRVLELEAGDGYYTRILGEYLVPDDEGRSRLSVLAPFVARQVFTEPKEAGPLLDRWLDLEVLTRSLDPSAELIPGAPLTSWSAPGRFDAVLGFRVVHAYRARGEERELYAAVRAALVPRGVFAVIAHRAPEDKLSKGYLTEKSVIAAVTRSGFVLDARSELNANPKDTHDYPHGVWSLRPTLLDGSKYAGVGESDRMTLRFRRSD